MNDPVAARPRRLVVGLGLLALTIAWITMAGLGWATPWYRHVEISPPTLSNALALNTALLPAGHHEPGLLTSYSLALDWRLRHHAGSPVAWNLAAIGQSGEPLAELRSLVHAGRAHSRLLVILLIICGGALACAVIPGLESGSFSVALLCSSAGLLYHGVVVRPELLGCGLGVGMLLSVWLGTAASTWWQHQRGLFIAGLCGGLAAVAQPSGLFYLLVGYSWCWLAGLTAPGPRPGRPGLYPGLLPLACAVVLLALAHQATVAGTLTAVTGERLRGFALLAGLLPLLALWPDSGRAGAFLRERAGEFALLGSGALGALILAFVALRAILPAEAALTAWT